MDGDKLSFLDDEPELEGAPPEAVEAVEPVAVEEPVEAAQGEDVAAPPAAEETRNAPLAALLDEREKRQSLERRLEEFERKAQEADRRLQELQAKPAEKIDFFEDPDRAFAQKDQQFQQALLNERLNTSEMIVRGQLDKDVVDAAVAAFEGAVKNDQSLAIKFSTQPHPYDFVVKWHKQQSILAEIGDDPAAWRAAQLEALRQELSATPTQTKPTAPPASLASAPSVSGQRTPAIGSAFDQAFPD